MSRKPFASEPAPFETRFLMGLAAILTVALIVPSVFLFVPQKAYAQALPLAVPTGTVYDISPTGIKTTVETTIVATQSILSKALAITNTAANYASMVNAYVLQPLALVLSGNLMKMLTAGVIAFVIGKANGTGAPQFVVDVAKSMQTVADGRALAYLRQVNQTHSPFAYSIRSALSTDYLTKSSLAGFWAANMNTLARSSPNVNAYLAGNWSQGGVVAWFALTTQVQNNPYSLYNNSRDQLASMIGPGVGGVTGAKAKDLSYGNGFMSWCKTSDTATQTQNVANTAWDTCKAGGSDDIVCRQVFEDAGGYASVGAGVNPGDPCMNADGTAGSIQTPGSTIKATLDKVLGGQQDQIVRMGNVGPQINQILGNIGTVMQTVNFASQLLGGGDKGGLLAVNSTSATRSISQLAQFTPTPVKDSSGKVTDFTTPVKDSSGKVVTTSGYLGSTQTNINATGAALATAAAANAAAGATEAAAASTATDAATGSDLSGRVTQYETAWNTIKASAETASTSVVSLASFCTTAANNALASGGSSIFTNAATAQAAAAQTALTTEIAAVFTKFDTASTTIVAARAATQRVGIEANTAASTPSSTYTADAQALQNMSPTIIDVFNAQTNANAAISSTANPTGSLVVSGGSLVSQMNLISSNAQALKTSACTPRGWPFTYGI